MKITARIVLNPEEVAWFESDINYTKIYLVDGSHLHISYTLKKVEGLVKNYPNFIRIHKSYIVNGIYISSVRTQEQETFVQLNNEQEFLVSRRRKSVLKGYT